MTKVNFVYLLRLSVERVMNQGKMWWEARRECVVLYEMADFCIDNIQ